MTYIKRFDGRKFDETREMEGKVGIVKNADGSAMFRFGDTIAIAAVYGPKDLYPRFLQNPEKGLLRCYYDMTSFSVTERKRPGPDRRSNEISLVSEKALVPVLTLERFPNAVVDVFIEIIQANAGTRCAGICAASLALADAGMDMKDLVCAVSVGFVDGKVMVDLNKEEEDIDSMTDIPIAVLPRTGEISLLQLDGNLKRENVVEAIELVKKVSKKIYEVQKMALKERFK